MVTGAAQPTAAVVEAWPRSARLKLDLLHHGARIASDATALIEHQGKAPLRVRSGSCGGLDAILPGGVYVNIPILEPFAAASPFTIRGGSGVPVLHRSDAAVGNGVPLSMVPSPSFHREPEGLSRIGQLCFDRLGVGLTNLCTFWKGSDRRCKFCSIGLNLGTEDRTKEHDDIRRVVNAAFSDPTNEARHVLFGGGTPRGDDAGGRAIAELARGTKEGWPNRSIYAMISPPSDLTVIGELARSGVDELGINLELFDVEAANRYLPGKHREIGRSQYLRAFERTVSHFGPINARSILIVGLESFEATLEGVELLSSMGVMPILSPFRPLAGTALEHHPRPSPDDLWNVGVEAAAVSARFGIPLGPTCIPCQGNTINVALHSAYHAY